MTSSRTSKKRASLLLHSRYQVAALYPLRLNPQASHVTIFRFSPRFFSLASLTPRFFSGPRFRARFFKQRAKASRSAPLPAALEEIRLRAANGHALDQVLWGKALLDSVWLVRDPKAARDWFTIAAAAHYGPAHNMLGRCAQFGWGGEIDLEQAVRHYADAAHLGDLWGQYNLGICCLRGIGCSPDRRRAFTLFRQAALRGHAKSMNLLARFMEEGWETPRNPKAALDWYRRSAEGGDYRGRHNYATALLTLNRPDEALTWWKLAVEDATPDILQAMERTLAQKNAPVDAALQTRLAERLAPYRSQIHAAHQASRQHASRQKDPSQKDFPQRDLPPETVIRAKAR